MLQDRVIRNLHNREYTYDEFVQIIKEYDRNGAEFYIGTDSQIIKKKISIVTCICVCVRGSNKVFYIKDRLNKNDLKNMQMPAFVLRQTKDISAIRLRMLLEAYRSIECAMEVEPYIKNKLHVHLDIGSTNKSRTSAFQKELEYLVQSQGYGCAIKPDSWAASAVADKMTKS